MRRELLREAERRAFCNLADLESIAVLAAQRGDGVAGQLEDELRHRALFVCEAELRGGYAPRQSPALNDLSDYLNGLDGNDSLLALNVVAERWLANIMAVLARRGFAEELLADIEIDERRHCAIAPVVFINAETIIGDLERLLKRLTNDPQFIAPFAPLIGADGLIEMGRAVCDAHEAACTLIGIRPQLRQIRAQMSVWAGGLRRLPIPVEMSAWQTAKQTMWQDSNEAALIFQSPLQTGSAAPAKVQAVVVAALGRVLARMPEARLVARGGQLYAAGDPSIAVRCTHNDGQVESVIIRQPNRLGWREIVRVLNIRIKRLRKADYKPPPDTRGVEDMLLPSPVVASVTLVPGVAGLRGYGPFVSAEGLPLAVTIGGAENGKHMITMRYDHRCGDGDLVNRLMAATIAETEGMLNARDSRA